MLQRWLQQVQRGGHCYQRPCHGAGSDRHCCVVRGASGVSPRAVQGSALGEVVGTRSAGGRWSAGALLSDFNDQRHRHSLRKLESQYRLNSYNLYSSVLKQWRFALAKYILDNFYAQRRMDWSISIIVLCTAEQGNLIIVAKIRPCWYGTCSRCYYWQAIGSKMGFLFNHSLGGKWSAEMFLCSVWETVIKQKLWRRCVHS